MKKIIYSLCLVLGAMAAVSCSDNSNWRILEQEFEEDPVAPAVTELYVPGNHQGWNPAEAPMIYAITGEPGAYAGYVNLDGGFKFTTLPSWDGIGYGSAGDGILSTDADAGNIEAVAGYYLATVNTAALTYKLELSNWGIIGDATPTGWDSDTDLVYDPKKMTLKVDITLIDGTIKFRANDDWAIDLGMAEGGTIEDPLQLKGANIPVKAGDYTVELDLSTPVYKLTLTKK